MVSLHGVSRQVRGERAEGLSNATTRDEGLVESAGRKMQKHWRYASKYVSALKELYCMREEGRRTPWAEMSDTLRGGQHLKGEQGEVAALRLGRQGDLGRNRAWPGRAGYRCPGRYERQDWKESFHSTREAIQCFRCPIL